MVFTPNAWTKFLIQPHYRLFWFLLRWKDFHRQAQNRFQIAVTIAQRISIAFRGFTLCKKNLSTFKSTWMKSDVLFPFCLALRKLWGSFGKTRDMQKSQQYAIINKNSLFKEMAFKMGKKYLSLTGYFYFCRVC